MAATKRSSTSWGRWIVVAAAAAVTVLIAVAAVVAWISPERLPGSARGPAVASSDPAPPVPSADPRTVALELTQAAPELTLASAEMLVAEVPNGAGTGLAEMALLLASRGFDAMERAELVELGQLFEEAYTRLPPPDHVWMGDYMRMLRDGSLDASGSERGRRLLTEGVSALPEEQRQRLQALLEKAIRAGIAARRTGEERTQPAGGPRE